VRSRSGSLTNRRCNRHLANNQGDPLMTWTTPQCTDYRFGFEITLYIANR
jgi:coenzyme PQQ precursor peptide PqqA